MMKSVKSRGGLTHESGLTESVRHMWVKSMHMCASVHSAMSDLTDLEHSSDDRQHVETGKSRNNRDFTDSLKLLEWFRNTTHLFLIIMHVIALHLVWQHLTQMTLNVILRKR